MNFSSYQGAKSVRQIVLDTETTGLEPAQGHRIIEIGCVEIIARKLTGHRFHVYLNPDREIDAGAIEVHGLTLEFLSTQPRFADIALDLLNFLKGSELIIHNAPFDIGFLDRELSLLGQQHGGINEYCTVLDTLILAKRKHPGQRNSLDALCKRYGVDNSKRDLHGALLDAEILAEVFLAMTGGQTSLSLEPEAEPSTGETEAITFQPRPTAFLERPKLKVVRCSAAEIATHSSRLDAIEKASNGRCLWRSFEFPDSPEEAHRLS